MHYKQQHQVKLIRSQMLMGSLGSITLVIASMMMFYPQLNDQFLAMLWAFFATLFAVINAVYAMLTKHADSTRKLKQSLYTLTTLGFCTGVIWGIPCLLILNLDFSVASNMSLLIFIIIAAMGMSAAGLGSTTAYLPMFYFSITPILLLLIVSCYYAPSDFINTTTLANILLIFALTIFVFAYNINRGIVDAIETRHQNAVLAQSYLEQKDKAQENEQAKSRFLAAASHDLRQPLYALSLYSEALTGEADRSLLSHITKGIEQTTNSLRAMLNSILDISQIDANSVPLTLEPVAIAQLFAAIDQHQQVNAKANGITLSFAPSTLWIRTDRNAITRIVSNLVANAIKYTDSGRVLVGVKRQGDALAINVYDTGIGIAPQELGKVFESYYQVDNQQRDTNKGLGLGLSIVKGLADNIGYELTVQSTLGKGSRFSVILPSWQHHGLPQASTESTLPSLQGFRVLLVDDDPNVLTATTLLMQRWKLKVACAESSHQAKKLIDKGFKPDVVVTDFRLGNNDSGIDLLNSISLRTDTDCSGIVITGDTAPKRLIQAQQSGYPIMHKPISALELRKALSELLHH